MSQAFALAVPHPSAMEAAPVVAFFQAVKARLAKPSDGSGKVWPQQLNWKPRRSNRPLTKRL